jgi:hypothetical protein
MCVIVSKHRLIICIINWVPQIITISKPRHVCKKLPHSRVPCGRVGFEAAFARARRVVVVGLFLVFYLLCVCVCVCVFVCERVIFLGGDMCVYI